MTKLKPFKDVYASARTKTRLSQQEIAERIGLHRGTLSRWSSGVSTPDSEHLRALVRLVHSLDAGAAEELAAAAGHSLASLEIVKPRVTRRTEVDAIVCAAADAADVAPRKMRAALLAAATQMRELDVSLAALEEALRVAPPARSGASPA